MGFLAPVRGELGLVGGPGSRTWAAKRQEALPLISCGVATPVQEPMPPAVRARAHDVALAQAFGRSSSDKITSPERRKLRWLERPVVDWIMMDV